MADPWVTSKRQKWPQSVRERLRPSGFSRRLEMPPNGLSGIKAMHPRRIHPLLALTLALCLTLAQLAVAAHGVVHPWEDAGNSHSPACQHLVGHGLGSALPASNTLDFASESSPFIGSAPRLLFFGSVTCRYQARAPPLAQFPLFI